MNECSFSSQVEMGTSLSRREQILATAGRLFSERGYSATSMRDLAAALGLTQGSLYNHLASKEELLFEIIDRVADQFLTSQEPLLKDTTSTATEKLRQAVRTHLRVMSDNLETATVFLHEWKFLSDDLKARTKAKRDLYEARLRSLVAEGIRRGEFRPVDAKTATRFLLSALNWFYQWYDPYGPLTAEAVADRYADLLLGGLARARARAR